ncbi:hypothetical protein RDWZM_002507 [Blomia tropicalis]|uniref:Uncharacterized protein n=1 Tax=Blomia tropicalis TaxID=40697 RepID=A0A9Q0MG85_BLOTA|nr:hypothetical protein RDWZM_002507 [Blomia tropicalis]
MHLATELISTRMSSSTSLCLMVLVVIGTIDAMFAMNDVGLGMGQHTAIRRLDCSVFCRKTGFSGYVGGCQCGFTLFANKRNEQFLPIGRARFLFQTPSTRMVCPESNNNNNNLSDDDSSGEPDSIHSVKDRQHEEMLSSR